MNLKLIILLSFFLIWVKAFSVSDTIFISEDVQLIEIAKGIYIHQTWTPYGTSGAKFSSNGLLIIENTKAFWVDTPMSEEHTAQLQQYISDSLKAKTEELIVCHFHDDCLGGLNLLHNVGVHSISNKLTWEICQQQQIEQTHEFFSDSIQFDFYNRKIFAYYFGAGHTIDNIVIYLPSEKILFGGCLIKSVHARGMGNVADAVVDEWYQTVESIKHSALKIDVVIPGHGAMGGKELFEHTQKLVKHYLKVH